MTFEHFYKLEGREIPEMDFGLFVGYIDDQIFVILGQCARNHHIRLLQPEDFFLFLDIVDHDLIQTGTKGKQELLLLIDQQIDHFKSSQLLNRVVFDVPKYEIIIDPCTDKGGIAQPLHLGDDVRVRAECFQVEAGFDAPDLYQLVN